MGDEEMEPKKEGISAFQTWVQLDAKYLVLRRLYKSTNNNVAAVVIYCVVLLHLLDQDNFYGSFKFGDLRNLSAWLHPTSTWEEV